MKNGSPALVVPALLSLVLLGGCQQFLEGFFRGLGREVPEPEVELVPQALEVLPRDFPGIENNEKGRREVVPAGPLQEE